MIRFLPSGLHRLFLDRSGVAMTEFALSLPFLLGAGLMGLETANRILVQMQISQLAVQVADNASRIGDTSTLEDRKIYEADINDLFYGAHLQSGQGVDLLAHGRVIVSSLQVIEGTRDKQYIAWQRCLGAKHHTSTYGEEGDGEMTSIPGMGPSGEEVIAFEDDAVMFVEISYDYQPIVGNTFAFGAHEINSIASFNVRDDRDLTGIHQINSSNPDPVADCAKHGGSHYSTTPGSNGTSGGTTTGGGTSGGGSRGKGGGRP